ncbi:hypothetical protein CI109_101951 [Kwoniella shandongensis]|uniref:Uncharacterized protein n=1 Tax=Kwoniella shandongensis TaxID=1734106 RepID=A0A5M6BXV0_9TREE|nr:uncharacterized protein CI109_005389 [Kwoniella shandongensis]KAA5526265.1 hypothetical protein CI109_005389 [Kwoniella shandongensis]
MSSRNGNKTPPPYAKKFPDSTVVPSQLPHWKWPGVTWESTQAVREVLEENDRGYDIYERRRFAHNHFSHSVLTRYALGAPAKALRDTWEHDKKHLVSLDPSGSDRKDVDEKKVPEKIDRDNWGDRKYIGVKGNYSRYLTFFHTEIDRMGPIRTVDKYIFAPDANWRPFKLENGEECEGPKMIDRLMAGVLHPFIHVGFGLEFGDRVVLAEGLAETAIHQDEITGRLITPEYLEQLSKPVDPSTAHTRRPARDVSSEDDLQPSTSREPRLGRSILEIYAIMTTSEKTTPPKYDPDSMINDKLIAATEDGRAQALRELVEQWSLCDEELADGKAGWERKYEEIAVFVTLLACGTGRQRHEPRVDFFLMHALTSSIFLPSYLPHLSIPNRRTLLRSYLLAVLHTSLSRGRPHLNPELVMSYDAFPVSPNTDGGLKQLKDARQALGEPQNKESRNPWLSLTEKSLAYPDSHVPKSIRSLVYFSSLYGATPPGNFIGTYLTGGQTHETIKGMSKVDGSLFIRAAGAIMSQVGKGEEAEWDRSALGYDEAWE